MDVFSHGASADLDHVGISQRAVSVIPSPKRAAGFIPRLRGECRSTGTQLPPHPAPARRRRRGGHRHATPIGLYPGGSAGGDGADPVHHDHPGRRVRAATQTVSDLKSAGDLAERLRGAATVIKRDLEADHCFDGPRAKSCGSVSGLWDRASEPTPPAQGFFRIYEGQSTSPPYAAGAAAGDEGPDINGFLSFYQTTASLAYTISLTRDAAQRLSVGVCARLAAHHRPRPVWACPTSGTRIRRRAQPSRRSTTRQSAEVALFLVPTGDVTDASGSGPLPLFGLYRRQFLTVPPTARWTRRRRGPAAVPSAQAPNYVEVSTVPSAGEPGPSTLADLYHAGAAASG